MANVKLALEQATYEIDTLDELIQLVQSGELDGLYLVVAGHGTYDHIFLSGHPTQWSVNLSGRATIYELFAQLFTRLTGMHVHLT